MYTIITDNKNEDNKQIIVKFKSLELAEKFYNTYSKANWYLRFHIDYLTEDIKRVKLHYRDVEILKWYNTDKFYRELLEELKR